MSRTQENPVSIFISPTSLHKGGNITGEIWLDVAGFEFSEKNWSDFPLIILGWWLDALFKLWSEKKGRGECLFMDGSYSFEVSQGGGAFVLRCFGDTHSRGGCEWEGAINLASLLRQVLAASAAIIKECRRRGWATVDAEALESKWIYMDGVLNPPSA